ncbi:MAG TPA: PKD domain-containing protein [Flavobacteriales bacterium]
MPCTKGSLTSWPRCLVVLVLCLPLLLSAQEICDNGIDDDGNGLVDLNDAVGCPCDLIPAQPSLVTNGSFEENTCCPEGVSMNPNDYLSCSNGWMDYMVTSTAEYFGCDFMPPGVPQPLPDGNAAAGFGAFTNWSGTDSYYEFLMNCLATPMVTGELYELEFNVAATRTSMSPAMAVVVTFPVDFGPIDLTLYGLGSCPASPYVFYDPVFGNPLPATYCPLDLGWTELGHVTYNPANTWQELSFTFTAPFDVQAIMFGPACPIPADYISSNTTWPYFFVDGLSVEPVQLTVDLTGGPCTDDLLLTAEPYEPLSSSYQWYLDGVAIVGATGETLPASALGLGTGTYTVRAIASDGTCSMAEIDVMADYPEPALTAVPDEGCAPLSVVLTNTTPAFSAQQEWQLGDGSTASSVTVTHVYTDPGTYDVLLSVTSAEGCTTDSLFEDLITVHPTPTASFALDTLIGCMGMEVTFTNTTTPIGTYTCAWDFGDGNTSSDCATTHAFASAGTYDVRLTVTSPFGCTDDTLMNEVIEILPTPEPAFDFSIDSGCVPLEVRFDNNTPGQEQQEPLWDLGNGEIATTLNAVTIYDTPGTYTVSLTMTNDLGCSATHTVTDAITAHGLPVVTFFVEPDTGCAPLDVQFTNTTDPGMIGGCTWAFGDGGGSSVCGADHTYTHPGTYTVSLTVTSPAGCEGDTTLYHLVHVLPTPVADFSFGPQPTDFYHSEITFTDDSSPDAIAWDWHFPFGDPGGSNDTNAVVTFPDDRAGLYPVRLVVTNIHGCTDTIVRPVEIEGVFTVFVPNAFTPNGDGFNDVFLPVIRDAEERDHDLRVFDRWGSEVFHATDRHRTWDGTVQGEGPKTDVYVWKLRVRSAVDGFMREFTGHVTVLP